MRAIPGRAAAGRSCRLPTPPAPLASWQPPATVTPLPSHLERAAARYGLEIAARDIQDSTTTSPASPSWSRRLGSRRTPRGRAGADGRWRARDAHDLRDRTPSRRPVPRARFPRRGRHQPEPHRVAAVGRAARGAIGSWCRSPAMPMPSRSPARWCSCASTRARCASSARSTPAERSVTDADPAPERPEPRHPRSPRAGDLRLHVPRRDRRGRACPRPRARLVARGIPIEPRGRADRPAGAARLRRGHLQLRRAVAHAATRCTTRSSPASGRRSRSTSATSPPASRGAERRSPRRRPGTRSSVMAGAATSRPSTGCSRRLPTDGSAMDHADHVALIRDGLDGAGRRWLELGAGSGAFTLALVDLLGDEAKSSASTVTPARFGSWRRRWQAGSLGVRSAAIVADFTRAAPGRAGLVRRRADGELAALRARQGARPARRHRHAASPAAGS